MSNPFDRPAVAAGKQPFKSDSSCFAPYANAKAPEDGIPECAVCGKPSKWGTVLEFEEARPTGRPMCVVEFSCGCSGKNYAVTSAQLYPAWSLRSRVKQGVWRMEKLGDAGKARRCSQPS